MVSYTDRLWIPRGLDRCTGKTFLLRLLPWFALLGFGAYAIWLCLRYGLNQTNMDNRFAFGLWIFLDLTVIALGAGAFFTGFLLYLMKFRELKAVINSAVVIGFLCYSGAMVALMVDVGQPLRAWFTFWHPNVHSMLTEVTFCISCYLTILAIEYLPIILKNRRLKQIPSFLLFEFELHKLMPVMAAVGTLLSFFHQGSLGGLYGVLSGRPFAFRQGFAIWPSTFFLFIISAVAVGPCFILLTTKLVERIANKPLVRSGVYQSLGKISGILLSIYVLLKCVDTLVWLNRTSPSLGVAPWEYYSHESFGTWILFAEIVLLGLFPALVLLSRRLRAKPIWLNTAAIAACLGIALNRFVLTIQTLALPTLAFDEFLSYLPSWQETGVFCAVLAYGVIVYSVSFRYLPLFPDEKEMTAPIETEDLEYVSGR